MDAIRADRAAMRKHRDEQPIVWFTPDKQGLQMHEIGDQHLIHIIRLCKHRRAEFLEQAQTLTDSAAEAHTVELLRQADMIIEAFVITAERRKLPVT